ncbi:hypothetical protein [Dongshaea marina]|uniref:hypothetical protein n=1 Tax=Dongshaea marina TaxID=2047966 RepID=UPI00190220D7|nr:hypothetical protein [Dongshaea marina]
MIVHTHKITKLSLFKLLIIGIGIFQLLTSVFFGICALIGIGWVHLNGEIVTGVKGLLTSLLLWPVMTIFLTLTVWIACIIGLWIYSWFGTLKIELKEVSQEREIEPDPSR